jgi:hypothetical protein
MLRPGDPRLFDRPDEARFDAELMRKDPGQVREQCNSLEVQLP